MPTLALAGDQVSKTLSFKVNEADKNIRHVTHLDDIKEKKTKQHLKRECKKLGLMPKHKRPAILLYTSAQCAIHDDWCVWLRRVVNCRQTCRFIAVDECHLTVTQGKTLRFAFDLLGKHFFQKHTDKISTISLFTCDLFGQVCKAALPHM
jgi:hypothetical protein